MLRQCRFQGLRLRIFILGLCVGTVVGEAFVQIERTSNGLSYFPMEENVDLHSTVHLQSRMKTTTEAQRTEAFPTEAPLQLNDFCWASASLKSVRCSNIESRQDFPEPQDFFGDVESVVLRGVQGPGEEVISLEDLHALFPAVQALSIFFRSEVLNGSNVLWSLLEVNDTTFAWESIRVLNLSGNQLPSEAIPTTLAHLFPRLQLLDLSNNNLTTFPLPSTGPSFNIDLSGNPLDCTTDFDWVARDRRRVVNADKTLCELPPHQNRRKPLLKVYPLVKKVRDECRLNCTCFVDYIWEQEKTIHSKTTVDCSFRNYLDFPDPDTLPRPTDTLYLSNNLIRSVGKFVEDSRYLKLNIMNLYLDNNKISSIAPLEGSDWFYNFQILSLRNNEISEVPVYALGNVIRQNKKLYFIDLSKNRWNCDCHYVSGFKMWLLRNSPYVKNAEEVQCLQTNEQIRQMKLEDWCKNEGAPLIEILDLVSITLALLIVVIICKVYYDYWNYKHKGKLPWLVSKM